MDILVALLVTQGALIASGLLIFETASRRWPFRGAMPARQRGFDALCVVLASVYEIAIYLLLAPLIGRLPEVAGFAWIADVAIAASRLPIWLACLVALLAGDFLHYWVHRLVFHHRSLWHIHALHHSGTHLYWASGYRGTALNFALMEVCFIVVALVLPIGGVGVLVLQAIYILNQHLTHSNIRLPWGPLAAVITTPQHHFLHHSSDARFHNANFGTMFIIWDKLFGTYVDPAVEAEAPLGLDYHARPIPLLLGLPAIREMRDV